MKQKLVMAVTLSYTYHKTALCISALVMITLLALFKPLQMHITIDQFINPEFQSSTDYFNLKKEFELGKTSILIIEKQKAAFTQADLCNIRLLSQTLTSNTSLLTNDFSPIYLRKTSFESHDQINFLNFPFALNLDCNSPSTSLVDFSPINNSPWRDILISKDNQNIVHSFNLTDTNAADFETKVVPKEADTIIEHFKVLTDKFKLHWAGDVTYQYYFKQGLDFNNRLNLLIILIVGIIFKFYFGTIISTVIFMSTVVFSSFLLFALMSLTHTPIDILNNSLILLLTISSLGDFVFLSSCEMKNSKHWLDSFTKIVTPSFLTSFTTFIGFISLCTSDIRIIKRLGLWGGISGIIEWFTIMILLPPVLKVCMGDKSWVVKGDIRSLHLINNIAKKFFSKSSSKFLLLIVLSIPFSLKYIQVNDQPATLFRTGNPFRESIDYMNSVFSFKGDVSLIFNDKSKQELNISKLLKIKGHPLITRIENPYENLNYFTKDAPLKYHQLIENNLKDTKQFKRIFSDKKARAILYLNEIDMKKIEDFRIYIRDQICQDQSCTLSGSLIAYADFSQKVPITLIESFMVSLILVFITITFLAYYTHNLKNLFYLSLSSIWGVALTLLLISLFKIQMNFITCAIISILVGMTGDNTIHYILASVDSNLDEGIEARSKASIINTITMVACSCIFLLYYFEPPTTFGLLMIFGLITSLLGDFWLLKGLIKK
jgi:predicted RND superfamily exporter protein